MIVSFTGHRQIDEAIARASLHQLLYRLSPEWAIVGGAAGADTNAAEICWHLDIPYTMALPHRAYASHYHLDTDNHWIDAFKRAAQIHYVVNEEKPFHFSANFKRNEWMVDESDLLIAISTFDPNGDEIPSKGGTAHCVRYARKVQRQIVWARCSCPLL